MALDMNLSGGQRAERKKLITVAKWNGTKYGGTADDCEVLGIRTPDSSLEFNPEVATNTDILGNTWTDVEKTEPTQSFDPYYIRGDSPLSEYLSRAALVNDINAFNNVFDIYIITAYLSETSSGTTKYYAVKHSNCSIVPQSLGGESYVGMPFDVHLSNIITEGTVDKLGDDFTFTPAAEA